MEFEILYDIIRSLVKNLSGLLKTKRLTVNEKIYLRSVILSMVRVTATSRFYINSGEQNQIGKEIIRIKLLDLFNKLNSEINSNQEFFPTDLIYGIRDKSSSWGVSENFDFNNSLPSLLPILNEIDTLCDNLIRRL